MLEHMYSRMPIHEDEYGDRVFNSNFYLLFLIIDVDNNYKLVIIYEKILGEYSTHLEGIIEIDKFWMCLTLWYFSYRILIFKS